MGTLTNNERRVIATPTLAVVEVQSVLVLTTGHLTYDTCQRMKAITPGPAIEWEYGWFVWVPDDGWVSEDPENDGIDLRACLERAEALGCEWVRFDCDGPYLAGLERFDW